MEIVRGDDSLLKDIDLDPQNVRQEVVQNCAIILGSIRQSIPYMRGLGVSGKHIGRPINVVENEIVADVYDQLDRYEPRAIIAGVRIETDQLTGKAIVIVEIEGVKEDG